MKSGFGRFCLLFTLALIACSLSCRRHHKAPQPTAGAFLDSGVNKCQLGDYRGAVADFNKAIELNPTNADAYISRGEARSHLNDYAGAIADDTKALELNPQYPERLLHSRQCQISSRRFCRNRC